ncbi:DUF3077 domain-containing protein [Pseudomonas sp. LS1212]|uniref:DUF3077 domain-containing protein n=1 Tax=Pseudomonas sp. LS1212 TaxID=2972478 RepID=UPI00215D5932|nr:DUF3077 domain-containing protein [Pseudomonas sp. LS1212]UVJ44986.1 DUF3077 domain-containing protein [Pseudomonas sp. LS1212]
MTELTDIKTLGTTTFGRCGQGTQRLFRITPDIPAIQALEHASNLQDCANKLAAQLAMGEGCAQTAWSTFYLGEMAKAIIDDMTATLSRFENH